MIEIIYFFPLIFALIGGGVSIMMRDYNSLPFMFLGGLTIGIFFMMLISFGSENSSSDFSSFCQAEYGSNSLVVGEPSRSNGKTFSCLEVLENGQAFVHKIQKTKWGYTPIKNGE